MCGPPRSGNDYRHGNLPPKRFLDHAHLATQWSIRRESEISIDFAQNCIRVTPTVIDVR
jgi:hypothetical protein